MSEGMPGEYVRGCLQKKMYVKRMNKPKVFFGGDDARTVKYTGMNWEVENDKLKNRVRRINLEEA